MMNTTYTFEQLKEDVRKEAEALKIHATKEERERLDFDNLNVTHKDKCIYGQMTGNCYSKRAAILIQNCAHKYFKSDVMVPDESVLEDVTLSSLLKYADVIEVEHFIRDRTDIFSDSHFSAIEAYILLPEAKNANLIAFLRGETETLEL